MERIKAFISYSWKDRSFVEYFCLKHINLYDIWIDKNNLDLNKDFHKQISTAIASANLFIYIESIHSKSSYWVNFELNKAKLLLGNEKIIRINKMLH